MLLNFFCLTCFALFLLKALKVILLLIVLYSYFLIFYFCFFHFSLYLSCFRWSFFSVSDFFYVLFLLLLLNFSQIYLRFLFLSFREMLPIFLLFAFCICFAGHELSTFISDVNTHEKRRLQEKHLVFGIFLKVPRLHEIWTLSWYIESGFT